MASRNTFRSLCRLGRSLSILQRGCNRTALISSAFSSRAFHPHFPAVNSVPGTRNLSSSATSHTFNVQDEDDFQSRVIENSLPVVVDFHATWCGPCKLLGPRLESIISGKNGKVVLAKLDIDDMSDLAMKYSVEAVPTVIGFKNGKVSAKFVGLLEDDKIDSFVEKLMN